MVGDSNCHVNPFRIRDTLVARPTMMRYTVANIPSRVHKRMIGTAVILTGRCHRHGKRSLMGRLRGRIGGIATPCGCPHIVRFISRLPGAVDNGVQQIRVQGGSRGWSYLGGGGGRSGAGLDGHLRRGYCGLGEGYSWVGGRPTVFTSMAVGRLETGSDGRGSFSS